ncbi:hypothetical protein V8F06_004526 [Rhypophila decipiens]
MANWYWKTLSMSWISGTGSCHVVAVLHDIGSRQAEQGCGMPNPFSGAAPLPVSLARIRIRKTGPRCLHTAGRRGKWLDLMVPSATGFIRLHKLHRARPSVLLV